MAATLAALAVTFDAAWIPVKAELAQWLLQRSWAAIQAGDATARPWPWADTRPAGVLRVPGLGIEQFVLEGNSGRNLAFGPVFVDAARSGQDRILSGHRDTHFRFLRRLRKDDRIELDTADGRERFVVEGADVIDSRTHELVIEPGIRRISLVTCYPFDAMRAGGPLRYVVTALPADELTASQRPMTRETENGARHDLYRHVSRVTRHGSCCSPRSAASG